MEKQEATSIRKEHLVGKQSLEELLNKAKTFPSMIEENSQCCKGFIRNCCDCKEKCGLEQWVSEKDVVEFFKDKVVVDRKQVQNIIGYLEHALFEDSERMLKTLLEKGSVEAPK